MYSLHSPKLKNIIGVSEYGKNIVLEYDESLTKYQNGNFSGYYLLKVDAQLVEEVYFDTFFQSQRYKEAVQKKLFSPKWEAYIQSRKVGEFYILDARDYIGELIRYVAGKPEKVFHFGYYGYIFWVYHDLGHDYLDHLYSKGTFKHKDEMDASVFAVIRLLREGIFDEKKVITEVTNAVGPLLKTGKYIDTDDVRYFFYYMKLFQNNL